MADVNHLWEYDHPYYCTEGNYLHSPYQKPHIESHSVFESWADFRESGWMETDPDMNLLFRWDWHAWHLEFPENYVDGAEHHVLQLFWVLQRKAFNRSMEVKVTVADEDEVRVWLADRARTIAAIWEPLVGVDGEVSGG